MSRVYWDTMLFAYWLEDHPEYSLRVQSIFDRMRRRGDSLHTSLFTLGELLAGPRKRNALPVADEIRNFMRSPAVDLVPFTADTAERYAAIRAANRISPADAIHLASAASAGIDLFITNDGRLKGLVVPGIHFMTGIEAEIL